MGAPKDLKFCEKLKTHTVVEINVLYQLSYGWWGIWAFGLELACAYKIIAHCLLSLQVDRTPNASKILNILQLCTKFHTKEPTLHSVSLAQPPHLYQLLVSVHKVSLQRCRCFGNSYQICYGGTNFVYSFSAFSAHPYQLSASTYKILIKSLVHLVALNKY